MRRSGHDDSRLGFGDEERPRIGVPSVGSSAVARSDYSERALPADFSSVTKSSGHRLGTPGAPPFVAGGGSDGGLANVISPVRLVSGAPSEQAPATRRCQMKLRAFILPVSEQIRKIAHHYCDENLRKSGLKVFTNKFLTDVSLAGAARQQSVRNRCA